MEMLQKQFAVPASVTPAVSTVSPKASSGAKVSPAKATSTVTSSSEYPREAVEIARAVQVAVEVKTGAGGREKPTAKGSTSSPATKWGRLASHSQPANKRYPPKGQGPGSDRPAMKERGGVARPGGTCGGGATEST